MNGDAAQAYAGSSLHVHKSAPSAVHGCVSDRAVAYVCVCAGKRQRDTVLHITALQMAVVSGCDSESE